MSLQGVRSFAVLFIAIVFVAPAALGQTCEYCTPENMDPGDYGWTDGFDDPTWTSGTPNAPTTLTCLARARNGQACRECIEAYNDNGTPKGYKVCAYVSWSSSCSCENGRTPYCKGYGVCRYES